MDLGPGSCEIGDRARRWEPVADLRSLLVSVDLIEFFLGEVRKPVEGLLRFGEEIVAVEFHAFGYPLETPSAAGSNAVGLGKYWVPSTNHPRQLEVGLLPIPGDE